MSDEKPSSPVETKPESNTHETLSLPETKARNGKRLDQPTYDAIWAAYRDGARIPAELAMRFGTSPDTVYRLIHDGYMRKGWRSLNERLKEWEKEQTEALARARAEDLLRVQDEHKKAREENLNLARAAKVGVAQTIRKMVDATKLAVTTKRRRMKLPDGSVAEVDVPPDIFEVARAWRVIAGAVGIIGQHDSLWLGGPTQRVETIGKVTPDAASELTPAQLRHIIESGGQLPDGVTDDMLFGAPSEQAN